jgi:hypothetical protein
MFWDRRVGDRRNRKSQEERAPDRRRAQGVASERRQWTCGILFRTSLPVDEIERWLEANATGRWAVGLEGIEEQLYAKVLKIMFENPEDKREFMDAFSRR